MSEKQQTIAEKYPITSALILLLVFISLFLNICALTEPFVIVYHKFLVYSETGLVYSLPGTARLMYKYKLYSIAILIVGFSIIFPFVKLSFLFIICYFMRSAPLRYRVVRTIDFFTKWSMFDVFVICIVLVLTNDQYFIDSKPQVGLYYFSIAIFLSIICSIILESLCEKSYPAATENKDKFIQFLVQKSNRYEKAFFILLLIGSFIFYLLAITNNYIQITDYFFIPNTYSIITTCVELWTKFRLLSVFVGIVLVALPFAIYNNLFLFWLFSYYPEFHNKIFHIITILRKFMMLDVFCLALILFLIEGKIIIKTEYKNGLYMLILFVLASFILPFIIKIYCFIKINIFYRLIKKNKIIF
ncbi:MAG: paraquat-inducible protein A [bacterium]|nr:paraquat-inducible protein A [bacterium]